MSYSHEEMMAMYRTMVRTRIYDEEVDRSCRQGRLQGMFHYSLWQEAISTAAVHAMKECDCFMPNHRSRGLQLFRLSEEQVLGEQLGLKSGIHKGISGDFHICVPSIGYIPNPGTLGSNAPISAGVAFALKRNRPGSVMVEFLGDGTFCGEGMVQEAVNWAAVQKLPIVFVVENNGVSMATMPEVSRTSENIADRARALGVDAVVVDGNDMLAVREVMDEAIERARTLCLPTVVEARTYRPYGHFNGDMIESRPSEYHEAMLKRYPDPIPRYEAVLVDEGVATQEELDQIKKETRKRLRKLMNDAYEVWKDPTNRTPISDVLDPNMMWANRMEGLQ